MRKIFTLFFVTALFCNSFAQTEVIVSTGAGYADEVYYSFQDSVIKTSPRTDWDIAFTSQTMSVSVLANTGAGLMLYTYPNGTINDWASVDTTGMEWDPMYNSIESWESGAFNVNVAADDVFDYGWGQYNMTNHFITGDSLYIVALSDTVFKKFAIIEKDAPNNKFVFKYADLDGASEVQDTIEANDYSTSFIHYSFTTGEVVDQEPDTRWQLLFTRYFDYNIPYYVTGVLANSGVSIQEVSGVSQSEFEDYDMELFSDTISQIGSDWKSFNMGTFQYDIADDVVYFVQDTLDGEEIHPIWKIYFTAFGGSTDGVYTFMKEELGETTGIKVINNHQISLYPNPASDYINVIHDFNSEIEISVYNTAGKLMLREYARGTSGLNSQRLEVDFLPTGIYNAVIRSEKELFTTKFLKK